MQLKTIQIRESGADPEATDDGFRQLHPIIQRVLLHRNITRKQDTDADFKQLLPPSGLKGIDRAAERIAVAIEQQQSILIVGDYDADGATASAVAVRGLRGMGAGHVRYKVPNRFSDGYGLSLKLAREIESNKPDLVITVDNGISSIDGIACLRQSGVDVIVTDHHLAGDVLPEAYAIVNPNQPGCTFKSKAIAGVGVMFYVLMMVRSELRTRAYFGIDRPEPNLAKLLDLVALGTVADVVPLDRNNRILVARGIERMRAGHLCPGIAAILKVAERDRHYLLAQDLGFVLGPRLNASGRLEDISSGIECLLTDDPLYAEQLAQKLDQINRTRKDIEQSMQNQALAALNKLNIRNDGAPLKRGLVLFDEAWHEGVVGLVASRMKEKTGVPVLVFAPGEGGLLKGSARSVPEVHIRDVLANIDARDTALIERFGGHAMAAGLSIQQHQLEAFSAAFEQEVAVALAKRPPANTVLTDGQLQSSELNRKFATTLQSLLPWGQNCPEPLFEGIFEVLNSRFVGEIHLKLVLRQTDPVAPGEASVEPKRIEQSRADKGWSERDRSEQGRPIDAICFRYVDHIDSVEKRVALELRYIRAVYSLDINRFRGKETLQLMIRYMEAA